jgi:signal transduction histidine kinase
MHIDAPHLSAQRLHDLLRALSCPAGDPDVPWVPDLEGLRRTLDVAALRLTLLDAGGHAVATHLAPPGERPGALPAEVHIPCQHGDRTVGTLDIHLVPGRELGEDRRWALEMVADRIALEAHHQALERSLSAVILGAEAADQLGRELSRGRDIEILLDLLLRRAVGMARAGSGALYLWEVAGEVLALQAHHPATGPEPPARVTAGRGIVGKVAQSAAAWRTPGPAAGAGQGAEEARKCQLAVPLVRDGSVRGVLYLEGAADAPFTEADVRAVTELAAQAGRAIATTELIHNLREERDLREDILAGTPNGVIAVDHRRRVLLANPTARQLFAARGEPGLREGHPIEQVLPQPQFLACLDRVLEGASERETLELGRDDADRHRDYLFHISRLRRGKSWAATVVARDMTEQRRLNEQMLRMGRVASLGQLAAGIAHEIRNPLTGISITLDILREEPGLSEEGQEMISDISREIDRLEALIHGLLDFARPREQEHRPMRLAKALEWHRTFREQCRNKGLACRLELDANPKIAGDPERLKQLFLNLAINALDATDAGGTVTLRTGVETGPDGLVRARVEISDTGRGMDPQTLEQVFDPFFTTKSEGTGLGLSIAHSIVEQHGGQIDVDSTPSRGTTFRVALPTCD